MNNTKIIKNKEFDGDIIITDPCYILRETNELTDDDWEACDYSNNMECLGIKTYIANDTLVGDWECTVRDTDSDEKLGEFCADSGQVAVFLLSEVLAYNPDFDYHINRPWTTTLIKDFKGKVEIGIETHHCIYDHDNETEYEDIKEAIVIGTGVNKKTGKPIRFVSE